MKNYVAFSEAAFKSAKAIPWKFPAMLCFQKFPDEFGKFPEFSPIFHGKAISPIF